MGKSPNDERLLTDLEAAHLLGITPALLWAYVNNPPKLCLGHDNKLPTVQVTGETMFRSVDVEAFDSYLQESWSTRGEDRPPIPTYISDYLKTECGGQCARCGKGFKLQNAHIHDYATSRSHHHHNLIRLCSHCHDEFDAKHIIPLGDIVALKKRLIEQNRRRIAERAPGWSVVITTAPSPASLFVGRETEADDLARLLADHRTVCVQGPPGIGKTQLVLNIVTRAEYDRPILWVNVESFDNILNIELYLRTALGASAPSGKQAALGTLLDSVRQCVVFDGVEAFSPGRLDDLEDFFSSLVQRTTTTNFLFTSQAELHGVDIEVRLELCSLSPTFSLEVLQKLSGDRGIESECDQQALARLVQFCDGHPLTLSVVGNLLRYFRSASGVENRIRKLGPAALQTPTRSTQTKQTSLNLSLSVAYSALQSEERRVLFVASHCPAGCIAALMDGRDNYGVADLESTIAGLRRWHLVSLDRTQGGERLHMLSPVRAFVQDTYERDEPAMADRLLLNLTQSLTALAVLLNSHYVHDGDVARGMVRFGQEFPNFTHVFSEAVSRSRKNREYLALIGFLASSLRVFCFVSGLWDRGAEIMRAGANTLRLLGLESIASDLLLHLTVLGRRLHDLELVRNTVGELVKIGKETTDSGVAGNVAMAQGMLAVQERRLNDARTDFESAIKFYGAAEQTASEGDPEIPSLPESPGPGEKRAPDEGMLALALFELGRIMEGTKEFSEALGVYERALSLIVKTKDGVNFGSVLHHMGNCHAYLNANEKALDHYVRSALSFAEIGSAEHLSNSLSELGYLLIDYDPGKSLEDLVPSSLIMAGMSDALAQAEESCSSEKDTLEPEVCVGIVRKVFGITALASLTSRNWLLPEWAQALRRRVVQPLVAQINNGTRQHCVPIMHLDVTTAIVCSIPSHPTLRGEKSRLRLRDVEHLARLCYRQYDWAWRAFRLFEWLSTYLKRCEQIDGLTAAALEVAARDSEEGGKPFVLPGFNRHGQKHRRKS